MQAATAPRLLIIGDVGHFFWQEDIFIDQMARRLLQMPGKPIIDVIPFEPRAAVRELREAPPSALLISMAQEPAAVMCNDASPCTKFYNDNIWTQALEQWVRGGGHLVFVGGASRPAWHPAACFQYAGRTLLLCALCVWEAERA